MEFFADDLRLTINIILIDMILSADNAIVIGLVASQFDPKIRQKVLVIGTSLAVLFRILFAVFVAYFLQYKGVRTFGGILLFYIAYKLYGDILKDNPIEQTKIKKSQLIKEGDKKNYWKAILTIIVADITISFDNVGLRGAPCTEPDWVDGIDDEFPGVRPCADGAGADRLSRWRTGSLA